jgi:hypothetical protein
VMFVQRAQPSIPQHVPTIHVCDIAVKEAGCGFAR